jgi:hypothetical protein
MVGQTLGTLETGEACILVQAHVNSKQHFDVRMSVQDTGEMS